MWAYTWVYSAWGGCTAACNGGVQSRSAQCYRTNMGTRAGSMAVDNSLCSGVAQAPLTRVCNTQTCTPTWFSHDCVPDKWAYLNASAPSYFYAPVAGVYNITLTTNLMSNCMKSSLYGTGGDGSNTRHPAQVYAGILGRDDATINAFAGDAWGYYSTPLMIGMFYFGKDGTAVFNPNIGERSPTWAPGTQQPVYTCSGGNDDERVCSITSYKTVYTRPFWTTNAINLGNIYLGVDQTFNLHFTATIKSDNDRIAIQIGGSGFSVTGVRVG